MVDVLYFSAESSDVSEPIKSQFLQYCSENTGSINPISYDVDVDIEIAEQYENNIDAFNQTARAWTEKYAN